MWRWAKFKNCGHGDPEGHCQISSRCEYQPEWMVVYVRPQPAFAEVDIPGSDEGSFSSEFVFGPVVPTYNGE